MNSEITLHKDPKRVLISVIVAVYNEENTLPAFLDSIRAQSFRNYEIIVIDGGSNDGTPQILEDNQSQLSYWLSSPDEGISDAWNKGVEKANGEWLIFLGADDHLFAYDTFEVMAPNLTGGGSNKLVYGKTIISGGIWDRVLVGGDWNNKKFLRRMTIPNPSSFYHCSLFDAKASFDISMNYSMDYEFLYRKLPLLSPLFVDLYVTKMGGLGQSAKYIRETLKENKIIQLKYRHLSAFNIYLYYIYYEIAEVLRKIRG